MSALSAKERRALKRLSATPSLALPIAAGQGEYGIFAAGDRRRRPLAKLDAASINRLVSLGALEPADIAEGLALSAAGRALLRRLETPGADAHRRQHQELEPFVGALADEAGAEGPAVMINRAESPLAWLMRRGGANGEPFLSPREFAAGEQLRRDYAKGRYLGRLTSDWTAPPRGSAARGASQAQLDPSEAVVAARSRVSRALEFVGGGLEGVLSAVCLEGRGLDDVERGFGWPRRSSKVVLRIALSRLADHYGLPSDPADTAA